jgi:DNA-binding transcriptional ArsR family regulator
MKAGPDIAIIAALMGDPARANMLTALMSGRALTASELAHEAGVTPQTASSHLSKLESGGLITIEKQGRHRYFRLTGPDVAALLESLMGVASRVGHLRTRTGPKDPALRHARVCYDHLAGDLGVRMFDSMTKQKLISAKDDTLALTSKGGLFCEKLGLDMVSVGKANRPVCKTCLDWSARRSHMAGSLGAVLLKQFYDLKWAKREPNSRVVTFSPKGENQFNKLFPV